MPITPPTSETPLRYTALDIITDALIENNMLASGEVPDGETGQWAFRQLNYVLDVWAARRAYVFAHVFAVYTLVPNLSPHTIGPEAATFPEVARPVEIVSANLLLNGSTELVDLPIAIRDNKWWAAQQTKQITSTVPTDLYYEPSWPNGNLWFWPVPQVGHNVRLELWLPLAQYDQINDPLAGPGAGGTMPQGYRAALTFTLALALCPGGSKQANPLLVEKAREANKAVFGNNDLSPRIATRDYGMPRTGQLRGYFNWGTGGPPGLGPR
ncbi:MAG TPA: hypothetical protein VHX11_08910 [Acidobacteriaceae bacterium]|jgi:hypothetical protein|nr:hypothetical protein [Acidobacteriaceae bacterium]